MTNSYDVGDVVRCSVEFKDANDLPADPTTVTINVCAAGQALTSYVYTVDPEVIKDGVGQYHIDISATIAGDWYYRWIGTGALVAAEEGRFHVRVAQCSS